MKKFLIIFAALILFIMITYQPISESLQTDNSPNSVSDASEINKPSAKPEATHKPSPTYSASPSAKPSSTPNNAFDPYEIINKLSDEELVGQLFLSRAPELNIAAEKAKNYHLGGYVLFSNHTQYESSESLRNYIDEIQSGCKIPMLIAVDEEGGSVTRLSRFSQYRSENFPSNRSLYAKGGFSLILQTEKEKCDLLKSLGFNVNLAPVCDITTEKGAFMYSRSLGESPNITSEFVSKLINLYEHENMGAVLKHFPGYGNNKDTHTGIATDNRSLDTLITNDLMPFFKGISEGSDAILISHTFINALDNTLPASLSPKVLSFLRDEMNFSGVIVTDDLVMQAVTDLYGTKEAAILAIKAGADLLCSTVFEIQYEAILEALKKGEITRKRLEESAARILIWKYNLNLIN